MGTEIIQKGKKAGRSDRLLFTAVGDVFLPGTVRFVDGKVLSSDEELGKTVFDRVAPYSQKSDVNFCSLMRKLCSRFGTRLVTQKQAEEVILKGKNLAKK